MSSPQERAAHIDNLRRLPDQLAAAVAGWTDAQLDARPDPREWSARQIVHHVADSHMNAFIRTKLALAEDKPTIRPYDQEVWAELIDTTQPPIEESLLILRGLHARWVRLWESLSESDFRRTYFHPEANSDVTLDEQLATYSQHGLDHIDQIRRIPR
jgi:hypothetical protein